MNMKESFICGAIAFAAVGFVGSLMVYLSNGGTQQSELTQMLMTIKADQERLTTENQELLAFKKALTDGICPKVEPVVQSQEPISSELEAAVTKLEDAVTELETTQLPPVEEESFDRSKIKLPLKTDPIPTEDTAEQPDPDVQLSQ